MPGQQDTISLFSLLQLSDTGLPIGAYAHSAGLETYVQQGLVHDATTAYAFAEQSLLLSIRYTDAALLSLAYDAALEADTQRLQDLDMICTAVKLPAETGMASNKLGLRLLKIFAPLYPHAVMHWYYRAIQERQHAGHYCIAFATVALAMEISKKDALTAFFYNAASGYVTNCVKLVPLSQQAGQEMLFALRPLIAEAVKYALEPDAEKIGYCCPGLDIAGMQHEKLYSRLYMS